MTDKNVRQLLSAHPPRLAGLCGLVIGMGESGEAVTELLLQEQATVWAFDSDLQKETMLRERWEPREIRLFVGDLQPCEGIDFCVISPGVTPTGSFFQWLHEQRIPLLGEMELAGRFIERPLIAITGTNGKTTVTGMTSHILQHCGYQAPEAGNVGFPLARAAVAWPRTGTDPLVVEVSSFQCETMDTFSPRIGIITNLAPDHLSRYASEHVYYETKFRMIKNQAPHEALWLGPRVEGYCPRWVPSRKRTFAMDTLGSDGLFFVDGTVIHRDDQKEERLSWPSLANKLSQQVLNTLAAVGAALSLGIPLREALQASESFHSKPHRLEWVAEVKGIQCYNDSKATNVHALEAALHSLPAPIRLIAGGRPKGDSLDPLQSLIREKVVAAYLIGEAALDFERAWNSLTKITIEPSLEEATRHALQEGKAGETLLLSPACASWDMFTDYQERGNLFKQIVKEWVE